MKFQVGVVVVVVVEDESDASSDSMRRDSGNVPEVPHTHDDDLRLAGPATILDVLVRLHAEFFSSNASKIV